MIAVVPSSQTVFGVLPTDDETQRFKKFRGKKEDLTEVRLLL